MIDFNEQGKCYFRMKVNMLIILLNSNDIINLNSENWKGWLAQGSWFFYNQTFHLQVTILNPNQIKRDWKLLTHDVAWWLIGNWLVVST